MSDYQDVRVAEISDRTVLMDVKETHPDMDAIHLLLLDDGALDRTRMGEVLTFGALLIRDYCDDESDDENLLLEWLESREAEDGEVPSPGWAEAFRPGVTYGTVAYGLSDWELL